MSRVLERCQPLQKRGVLSRSFLRGIKKKQKACRGIGDVSSVTYSAQALNQARVRLGAPPPQPGPS